MNAWHRLSITEAVSLLATDVEQGLSVMANNRLAWYGQNKLRKGKRFSALVIFVSQFKSLVIWVLIGAAAVSAALGETIDGIAIIAIVILNIPMLQTLFQIEPVSLNQCVAWIGVGFIPLIVLELRKVIRRPRTKKSCACQ